jgi:inosose dehydratase
MVAHIKEIAKISYNAYGVRSVIHHHAGGFIDYSEEIDRILQDIPEEDVGLCFDTGHAFYAGIDPEEGIRRYGPRIDYVHFKDVNQSVYDIVKDENIGFYEACFQGLMCPLGEGALDYSSIKRALEDIDYHGWITLEQDKDPHDTENVPASLNQSISHLKKLGFQ